MNVDRFLAMRFLTFLSLLLAVPANAQIVDNDSVQDPGPLPLPPGSSYVLHNATIYTVDGENSMATAMAVDGERIVAVGGEEILSDYPDWPRLDARGHAVVPGLIDAHAHLMGLGETLLQADLVGATSRAEVLERLEAFEADLPGGAWLQGRGWDQNDWKDGNAFPTAADLDVLFPDRPVWLIRVDGHAGWANSAAMRLAGVSAETTTPAGGEIIRDGRNRPAGIFVDNAMALIEKAVPPLTGDEAREALRRATRKTARYGLTGIHDAGTPRAARRLYEQAIEEGDFPLRVYGMLPPGELNAYCDEGQVPYEHESARLVIRSMKLYSDGALGSRGAALLADYSDDPGNRGLLLDDEETLQNLVTRAMACGLQVNTHAIGDRANRLMLDIYEEAVEETGGGPGRHRIEHAQVLHPTDIPRFAGLGVIASVQPTHATSDMPWAHERLGDDRLEGAYAWQSLLESGARLALGSDFPVEHVNPLFGFYAAVTRRDHEGNPAGGWFPEQRLSREEALRGFTIDAAYAAFMEDEVGSLDVGKRADFVILDQDIMSVEASEIPETRVLATYIDGVPVYEID